MEMKAFMKVCGIIALALLGAGIVFTICGFIIGSPEEIAQGVERATDGKIALHLDPNDSNFGIMIGNYSISDLDGFLDSYVDDKIYDLDDSDVIYDGDAKIQKGDIEPYCLSCKGIENLEISAGGCNFSIVYSDDDDFWIEAKKVGKLQVDAKGDKLVVKSTRTGKVSGAEIKDTEIKLYVPQNIKFDQIKIDLGAGVLSSALLQAKSVAAKIGAGNVAIDGCVSDKMNVNVGAGDFYVYKMAVGELNCEVGMGNISLAGKLNKDAKIECSMGNVEVYLEQPEKEFNYKVEASMGNVNLGEESFAGLAKEKKVDNDADKTIQIQCAMGNVNLEFAE